MATMKISCFLAVVSLLSPIMATNDLLSATEVSNANTKFTSNLYQLLSKTPGNVFFSPISAHAVLALAYQGAGGKTAEALRTSLNLPETKSAAIGYKNIMSELNNVPNVTLHIANKVFVAHIAKLKDDFKTVATRDFYAEAENINFSDNKNAALQINNWVENKTNDKIKDLIAPDDLSADTRLVLVNAIYFKGDWLHKFPIHNTLKQKFYLNDKDTIDCDMMHITEHFGYAEDAELDAKILRLPYKNKDVSMVIVLPNTKTGIFALEQKLANRDLTTLTNQLVDREVIVALPKFKIETTIDLKDSLEKLGLGVIFSQEADFPNMIDGDEKLVVSKVIQKAFIEVNEEGAEAAAATGLTAVFYSSASQPRVYTFRADHAFMAYIEIDINTNKDILFFAKVNEVPTE